MISMHLLVLATSFAATDALRITPWQPRPALGSSRHADVRMMDARTEAEIKEMITANPVMLFMKGSKLFPQCGFSNTAVQILNSLNVPFETCDVLANPSIREGIKECAAFLFSMGVD